MPSFNAERFRGIAAAAGDNTLDEISQRTGIDTGLLSRLLRGERKPSFDTLTAAADGYKVLVDDLIVRDWQKNVPASATLVRENAA